MKKVNTLNDWRQRLDWGEGLRTFLCMLPMAVAYAAGYGGVGVPMGQAGFFVAAQPITRMPFFRMTNGLLFLVVGLGLYLIGGTVVFTYPAALLFTFLVSMGLALMSGWRMASLLAFTFFSVYSAGLNSSSPEKVTANFYAFGVAILWGTLVSLPRWWKGTKMPPFVKPSLLIRFETGMRMGIATTLAYAIADFLQFTKMGWAPSAAANVIRFETDISKKRAMLRAVGTVLGAIAVLLISFFIPNTAYWITIAIIIAVANGLTVKINKLGFLPFYTTVVLILYSLNDPTLTTSLTFQRVAYNVLGVLIAILAVIYPFPRLMKRIKSAPVFVAEMDKADKKLEP